MIPRKITVPNLTTPIETGLLQVNDYWRGLYIRGDDAFNFLQALRTLKIQTQPPTLMTQALIARHVVGELLTLLEGVNDDK